MLRSIFTFSFSLLKIDLKIIDDYLLCQESIVFLRPTYAETAETAETPFISKSRSDTRL